MVADGESLEVGVCVSPKFGLTCDFIFKIVIFMTIGIYAKMKET